jgi:phage terminase large subunit-like protein
LASKVRETRDYCGIARKYAEDVVAGKILACKWVRLACERQLNDLQRWAKSGPYKWDPEKAARVCKFIELLPHIKGPKAGSTIFLEPWQCFILTTGFGWVKRDTGTRRFRKVYIEVPRGNAKSTISAGVALYMAFADGEGGAEAYSAATTREQAKEVWEPAWHMVKQSPGLRKRFGVDASAHSIHQTSTASKFHPLSSDQDTLDGKNIQIAIVDELHAHKTRGVHDVLETGIGKRTQSMLWEITTAGFNRTGICYEVRTYIAKVLERVVEDDSYFGIVWTIDDDDDWTTEEALVKANPNWGVSVDMDLVRSLQRKAMQIASAVNNFLTKHLDVWVSADTAWMDMRAWDACADPTLRIEDFYHKPCIVALDLASKTDIAAMALLFDKGDEYYLFGRSYLPEAAAEDSSNSQYSGWVREKRIITTPGNITDYEYIENDLKLLATQHQIEEIPYDPFQATYLATRMLAEGLPMVEMGQTTRNLSEPMKQFEALVLSGKLHHNGCPVLTWMVSNVVAHEDVKENIYPRKDRPENKIDLAVAAIMALARKIAGQQSAAPSVWSLG